MKTLTIAQMKSDGLETERLAATRLGVSTDKLRLPEPKAQLEGSGASLYDPTKVRLWVPEEGVGGTREYVPLLAGKGSVVLWDGPGRYARHLYGCWVMDQTRNENTTWESHDLDESPPPRPGHPQWPKGMTLREFFYPCGHCH